MGPETRLVVDIDAIDVSYELERRNTGSRRLPEADAIRLWIGRTIQVLSSEGACASTVGTVRATTRDGRPFVAVPIVFACPGLGELTLIDNAVFPDDRQHESIVRFGGSDATAHVLRFGSREMVLRPDASFGGTVQRFLVEGALHFATGYDHILFLFTLLLIAGASAAEKGLRLGIRNTALVVTGFTLGHTLTLIAAAFDVVVLPTRITESGIALSIVIVAVWNLFDPRMRPSLPWIASAFGLIHGFGFSSVLKELLLPTGSRVTALLAFNVGIELAQLAVVAIVIFPLAWAARRDWYKPYVIQAGSVAIALLGAYWLISRAAGG